MRRRTEVRRPSFPRCWPTWISRPRHRDRRHQLRLVTGPPGGLTGPRWDGGPAGGLIKFEVSSLGGPDYATTNGVRREQDGRHLIYFKGQIYRPVEPGDLEK